MVQKYPASRRGMSARAADHSGSKSRPRRKYGVKKAPSDKRVSVAGVLLSHPNRVYWDDVGVTKKELAEFYVEIWDWMRPHIIGRPIALVRCPEGASSECFFQKHASAGIGDKFLHLVAEKGDKIISIDDLPGLISLVQAGVLELHTRGTTNAHREEADRLVFDLDPGPGIDWKDIIAAAREVRERLQQLKLETFIKTSGGKGLHVVLPIKPTPWEAAKEFARTVAEAMSADSPDRYVATATKSERGRKIFVDYLRNSREATAVAPYSTRARPGAPVSVPVAWSELATLKSASHYNVRNLPTRLKRLRADPWERIGRLRPSIDRWV